MKKTYLIDGNDSGFPNTMGSMGWYPDELYGQDITEIYDTDEQGRVVVEGYREALALTRRLFDGFSTPFLAEGEEYRVRFDLTDASGKLIRRFERTESGE